MHSASKSPRVLCPRGAGVSHATEFAEHWDAGLQGLSERKATALPGDVYNDLICITFHHTLAAAISKEISRRIPMYQCFQLQLPVGMT